MTDGAALPDLNSAVVRARRLLALLRELTEIGMELARGLGREPHADVVTRYCRIAKAIRQLIALEARLAQALEDAASGHWAAEDAERTLRALADEARQAEAIETLGQAVREGGDGEAVERLTDRLADWHAERSVERDFTEKSVAEIVVGACKNLGIAPDPAVLADETMSETLADAVRAYAAALEAAPSRRPFAAVANDTGSPPPPRRPNAIADPRPPPA
jgi:hypothetical protein